MNVLLIEDEKLTRISLGNMLKKHGDSVTLCETGIEGLEQIKAKQWDLVITDLRLPKTNGIEIIKYLKENQPDCEVIVITAYATVETAVEALKMGAYDYMTKPFEPDKLLQIVNHVRQLHEVSQENKQLKKQLRRIIKRKVIGTSKVMTKLLQTISVVAPNDYTVLIQGESGTGKELIAHQIHDLSSRKKQPFVPINCAVIPETLLESELFGHEKGAFSGAVKQHIGYFERANGGTIFIDDIDDFPYSLQVKLLRVLQERELVRVGGTQTIQVDVRIICATKVDLGQRVREQKFRDDLYYRLNIIPLQLPPLRERKDDIPALIQYFLEKRGIGDSSAILTPDVLERLMAYDWPGNVRELDNIVKRLIALSQVGVVDDSLFYGLNIEPKSNDFNEDNFPPLVEYLASCEEKAIRHALDKCGSNISKAAETLQIPRSTLNSKMDKLGIR